MNLEILADVSLTTLITIVVLGVITYFSRKWITALVTKSVQYDFDKKLSEHNLEIKNKIDEKMALYNASNSSYLAAQQVSINKKIENIEKLWAAVIKLKSNLPPVMVIIDSLTEKEFLDPQINIYDKYTIDIDKDLMSKISSPDIEKVRPFLGDKLWYLFFVYQAVQLRAILLFSTFLERKAIEEKVWFRDKGVIGLLKAVLNKSEMKELESLEFQKMSYFQKTMETKILTEMQKVIDGKHFSENSFKNAQEIQEAVNKIELDKMVKKPV